MEYFILKGNFKKKVFPFFTYVKKLINFI